MAARIQARSAAARRGVAAVNRPVFRAAAVIARADKKEDAPAASIKGGGKGGEEGAKDYGKTLFGMLAKNGDCMMVSTGITKSGLQEMLMEEGSKEYTLFAPSDDAFGTYAKKIGVTKLDFFDIDNLPEIMKNHLVEGKLPMDSIPEEITTLAGNTIKAPKVVMNKGRSKKRWANFNSTNGCFHIIDEVLEA